MGNSLTSNEFLFGFQGRINRARYWYAVFASMIACLVFLFLLAGALGAIFGTGVKSVDLNTFGLFGDSPSLPFKANFNGAGPGSPVSLLFYALGTPIFVGGLWFLAATTVKRLHDRGKSGWWIVPFIVVPNLLGKIGDGLAVSWLAIFLALVMVVLSCWAFVEMLCLRGSKGPNRFGADPLAPAAPIAPTETRPPWDQQSEIEFVPHRAGPPPS